MKKAYKKKNCNVKLKFSSKDVNLNNFFLLIDQKGATTALAFIGRFMASGSFANIYLYSSELYPTELRYFIVRIANLSF